MPIIREHPNGIVFKVRKQYKTGLVALSPVYGYKSRVSMDVNLVENEVWELLCPDCDETLPAYSQCSCGADLITLFTNPDGNYGDCILICSRIGCFNARIQYGNEALTSTMIEAC